MSADFRAVFLAQIKCSVVITSSKDLVIVITKVALGVFSFSRWCHLIYRKACVVRAVEFDGVPHRRGCVLCFTLPNHGKDPPRMADDLSQFFAKKAAKSKDKKKKVKVSVDDVGQVLERKAKRQEERDRENDEEEKRAQEEAIFFEKRTEDSEWLEFKDTNREISLEELGIRDMNLTEQAEEALDEEKTTPTEAPKTWNTATTEVKEPEEVIAPPKPAIWRPRHQLAAQNALRGGAAPNIADQEMFPTFADAEKIEKLKKDDEKKRKNDGFTTVTSARDTQSAWTQRTPASINAWQRVGAPTSAASDRAALFSAVTSGGAPNPVPPSQSTPAKNPNAYVPPSRRRAEAAMQMQ
ncbi:hypothetical protein Tcan_10689 [Toxocara canis]|uniref:Uncharacterized protein n=1 Tax=Toxocara canis TaxID=6265 RepID=A0A0B2VNF2_TOXCA|nr:hypothetical protein Tcan_10689 [Toxocara canis]